MPNERPLSLTERLHLAATASVDPRTIERVYRGKRVRGAAGERARAVLVQAGLLPPTEERAA